MNAAAPAHEPEALRFRRRLLVVLMVLVSVITGVMILLARRAIALEEEANRAREFQSALTALRSVQQVRHSMLLERCRALARKPRIHAALEDGGLDLLYLSARDELRDILFSPRATSAGPDLPSLHARFYRFLDVTGQVIPDAAEDQVGVLTEGEEARLALPELSDRPQLGYLSTPHLDVPVVELVAMPIISVETAQPIAALVLGFPPAQYDRASLAGAVASGVWLEGALHLQGLPPEIRSLVEERLRLTLGEPNEPRAEGAFDLTMDRAGYSVHFKQLNAGSMYPPVHEVSVFSLEDMAARQRRRGWQIFAAGAGVVLVGFGASQGISRRFARPVEALEHETEEQRLQRLRAEAALETTSAELQRAARFSADASHQLKTPVTVLRAGLEDLLAKARLTPQECDEVAGLIHQTYRLSSIIEDLLLLSRLDAGRLQLQIAPVDLSQLIAASLDDLDALPDELGLQIETEFPPDLLIAGEKRYTTLILQNLLENARKYNRPGGRIRIVARTAPGAVRLSIANTVLRPIPLEARAHIFERFHRAAMGEDIPGYGLGLNLARELARIHGGELRLVRSDSEWTELEVRFLPAPLDGRAPREGGNSSYSKS